MAKRTSPVASTPTLKLAPAVRLVKPEDCPINQDYVDCIRALLRRAESGESTGLAYVETLSTKSKKSYRMDAIGILNENHTFCLGTIEVLKAKLLKRVMGS